MRMHFTQGEVGKYKTQFGVEMPEDDVQRAMRLAAGGAFKIAVFNQRDWRAGQTPEYGGCLGQEAADRAGNKGA